MRRIIILGLFFLSSLNLFSHPHMFFTSRFEFEFNTEGKPEGVWILWEFDNYFTEDLLMTYDYDENRIFDKSETRELYDYAFAHLVDYGFYVFIRQGNKRKMTKKVRNFTVFLKEGIVCYRFMVPLDTLQDGEFFVAVYDPTYFCEITYPEDRLTVFSGNPPENIKYDIVENRDYPVYFDITQPVGDTTMHTEWRPGLSTFIPQEVHVFE